MSLIKSKMNLSVRSVLSVVQMFLLMSGAQADGTLMLIFIFLCFMMFVIQIL